MNDRLQKISLALTNWVGTPASVVVHTILFAASFGSLFFGISLNDVLLVLTTIVSLEAIYLAIFIQMTVNRHTEHLEEVGADIEDIQEEVEDLGEDVEEISEDIEKIQEEQSEEGTEDEKTQAAFMEIQTTLRRLLVEVEALKSKPHGSAPHAAHAPFLSSEPSLESSLDPKPAPDESGNHREGTLKKIIHFISNKGRSVDEPLAPGSETPPEGAE